MQSAQQASNPLFYSAPQPLSRLEHANLKVVVSADFSFARDATSVPLAISEFSAASGHYPIAFIQADDPEALPMPVAILSISRQGNQFLEGDGSWRRSTYVPAYVRRYPFAFATDAGGGNMVLCADMSSDRISTSEGIPLFNDGQPSEATTRMLSFCTSYQQDHLATERFTTCLRDLGLLREQRLVIRGSSNSRVLTGLHLLDRARFRNLDDATFLKLRTQGYLGPVYAHLASLHRLRELAV